MTGIRSTEELGSGKMAFGDILEQGSVLWVMCRVPGPTTHRLDQLEPLRCNG